ncbi:MAG: argininosuccinate lyase [Bacteroidetes bacterium]|nr:argininosuccinate lyase [Bacteroidota bacterium]
MKLWQKDSDTDQLVEAFTIGRDAEFDLLLAPWDVLGSLAHSHMLTKAGLLSATEGALLREGLLRIHREIGEGRFSIAPGVEDVHSQVELLLTRQLGDVGKRLHTGRSRNDQVLLDVRLYVRHRLRALLPQIEQVFTCWLRRADELKAHLLPGYTHFQVAMPSSFGLWLSAYAESLTDDLISLEAAYRINNRNPLGSAAGYGSSFPLDRDLVTNLLGFEDTVTNSIYAQMGRGKTERVVAQALAGIAATLGKMAMDAILYLCQNFSFISFPARLTTGSSIMPHKKNPDVFELIRARCNRLMALPNEIALLTTNLPHGYHRDLQLLKEHFFPAFDELEQCLRMTVLMFEHMEVRKDILEDELYRYAFSVDAVNERVKQGESFRDAYHQVGQSIEAGTFVRPATLSHTHTGSLGNLGLDNIRKRWQATAGRWDMSTSLEAEKNLLA